MIDKGSLGCVGSHLILLQACLYRIHQAALLEKKGQAANFLDKYGIGSETDVSGLEQHDFSELESHALACKESEALV
jgi:hypothetical protein